MKNPLRKCLILLTALLASSVLSFAQSNGNEKIPDIQINKVDFKLVAPPIASGDPKYKWGQTVIDFTVNPSADFTATQWLNNVKMTLTLVYKKTAQSLGAKRGKAGEKALEKERAEAGNTEASKYTSYRASVTFVAVGVADGKKQFAFFIPGEIVKRDNLTGSGKPMYYYIEFEYNDMVISPFDAKGKKRNNYVDSPTATGNYIIKQAADFEKVREWADAGVGETKGQLIPMHILPTQFKYVSPYVIREEVQQ